MLGFLESPKKPKEILGAISDDEVNKFTVRDCDDYLAITHTKKELANMSLEDKKTLILELEWNFKQNSI